MPLVLTTTDNIKIEVQTPEKNYNEKALKITVPGPMVTPEEKKPDVVLIVNLSPSDLFHLMHMLKQ